MGFERSIRRALARLLPRRPSPLIHYATRIRPDGVAVALCYRGDRAISRRARWTLDAEGVTCRRCNAAMRKSLREAFAELRAMEPTP